MWAGGWPGPGSRRPGAAAGLPGQPLVDDRLVNGGQEPVFSSSGHSRPGALAHERHERDVRPAGVHEEMVAHIEHLLAGERLRERLVRESSEGIAVGQGDHPHAHPTPTATRALGGAGLPPRPSQSRSARFLIPSAPFNMALPRRSMED